MLGGGRPLSAVLLTLLGIFAFTLGHRTDAEVTVLRGLGAPYTRDAEGRIVNQARIRIHNRSMDDRHFLVTLVGADDVRMIAPQNPLPVGGRKLVTTSIFLIADRASIPDGEREVTLRIADGKRFSVDVPDRLVGPHDEDDLEEESGKDEEER
jgi:hypothetical protein